MRNICHNITEVIQANESIEIEYEEEEGRRVIFRKGVSTHNLTPCTL